MPDVEVVLLLCAAAFLAGWIDAVAGGGGLIQLPALLILMPGAYVPNAPIDDLR